MVPGAAPVAAPAGGPAEPVKPRWRGVLHTWAFAVSFATGAALVAAAPDPLARLGAAIYAVATLGLFGTSALYHRRTWSPGARAVLKRLDHSMIFLFIAGTFTPFILLLLRGVDRLVVLVVVWAGAAIGIALRMIWLRAPRWVVVPPYLGLGWVAIAVLPEVLLRGGVTPLVLTCVGGVLYSWGAVVYASLRPDPRPAVFGYHEVFHLLTVLATLCCYVAVFLSMFAAGAAGATG